MIQLNRTAEPWNKGRKLPPEPLTTAEVERLIKAATDRYPTGRRNRALLVCLWRGGLRCQEVLDLMPKDIDTRAGTIRVLHGKGDKTRLVGLDSGAVALKVEDIIALSREVARSFDLREKPLRELQLGKIATDPALEIPAARTFNSPVTHNDQPRSDQAA